MVRSLTSRFIVASLLAVVAAAMVCVESGFGADAEPAKKAAKKSHRLPPYYSDFVTPEQREKIYKIQDDFKPKIDALEAQLKTLKQQQSDKIEALLTPEQKKKLEAAATKAKEEQAKKRAEKKAEKRAEKKDAAKADAAPPANAKPTK